MRLWLDNTRPPPQSGDWTWVKTVPEAQRHLTAGTVTHASLDHDLDTPTSGSDLLAWMQQTGNWPTHAPKVHTGNADAGIAMKAFIAQNCPNPPAPTDVKSDNRLSAGGSQRYSPSGTRKTLY